jgi:hypothetical protein
VAIPSLSHHAVLALNQLQEEGLIEVSLSTPFGQLTSLLGLYFPRGWVSMKFGYRGTNVACLASVPSVSHRIVIALN